MTWSFMINNFCSSDPRFIQLKYTVYNHNIKVEFDNCYCLAFDFVAVALKVPGGVNGLSLWLTVLVYTRLNLHC